MTEFHGDSFFCLFPRDVEFKQAPELVAKGLGQYFAAVAEQATGKNGWDKPRYSRGPLSTALDTWSLQNFFECWSVNQILTQARISLASMADTYQGFHDEFAIFDISRRWIESIVLEATSSVASHAGETSTPHDLVAVFRDLPRATARNFMDVLCSELALPAMRHHPVECHWGRSAGVKETLSYFLAFQHGRQISAPPNSDRRVELIMPAIDAAISAHHAKIAADAGLSGVTDPKQLVARIADKTTDALTEGGAVVARPMFSLEPLPAEYKNRLTQEAEKFPPSPDLNQAVSGFADSLHSALERAARMAAHATVFIDDREYFQYPPLANL